MDYSALRDRMVAEQLIPRGIYSEKVLSAFRKVKRHEFVPADLRDDAYRDHPLPIGKGQTISQPYMVALMTQLLNLNGTEKVLEVGAGSGYQAAILAELAKEVHSVERIESLAKEAQATLDNLGYQNVKIHLGDGTLGWEECAPYGGIIVTAASPKIPGTFIKQLETGGRLVIPVGPMFSQILTVVEKKKDSLRTEEICGCIFVPLIGKEGWGEKEQ